MTVINLLLQCMLAASRKEMSLPPFPVIRARNCIAASG